MDCVGGAVEEDEGRLDGGSQATMLSLKREYSLANSNLWKA